MTQPKKGAAPKTASTKPRQKRPAPATAKEKSLGVEVVNLKDRMSLLRQDFMAQYGKLERTQTQVRELTATRDALASALAKAMQEIDLLRPRPPYDEDIPF